MLISLVVYCLLGAIAGVLAGLLGVGGGIVIVPMLVFAFGWQNFPPDVLMLMALGTSMGSIMFTSISSSLAHSRNKGVQWDAVRNITPGILIGTFCGSFLASHVPARFLQLFFVAFLFFVITQMLSGKKPKPSRHLPGLGGMSVAGGIIGVVSSPESWCRHRRTAARSTGRPRCAGTARGQQCRPCLRSLRQPRACRHTWRGPPRWCR